MAVLFGSIGIGSNPIVSMDYLMIKFKYKRLAQFGRAVDLHSKGY